MFAGFGGQGILFAGKYLVYAGMLDGHEVSWLPSYGPEMRGGTANCSVIISEQPIGSPLVNAPNILAVMNLPSFDKFECTTAPGGKVFVDSTLIARKAERTDVETFYIPATQLAKDNGMAKLANMIIVGKILREAGVCGEETIAKTMAKVVPSGKPELFDLNMRALSLGLNYR